MLIIQTRVEHAAEEVILQQGLLFVIYVQLGPIRYLDRQVVRLVMRPHTLIVVVHLVHVVHLVRSLYRLHQGVRQLLILPTPLFI